MKKKKLKEIAKQWCKSVLIASEALESFADSELSYDECDYLQSEIIKIANRISSLPYEVNTNLLVSKHKYP